MNYSFLRNLALGATVASVLSGGAVAGDAAKGKIAYVKNGCYQCHGFVGQGGQAGPKLAPKAMPEEAFVNFVRTTNRAMRLTRSRSCPTTTSPTSMPMWHRYQRVPIQKRFNS